MAINKVVYGGNTLVDLTDTTATASDVAAGKYFYAADGTKQLGTSEGGTSGGDIYQDEDGYLVLGEEGGSSSGVDAREDLTEPKDVDFIDYDGRLIYSYTAEEFLALSALPPNPSNEGLIAQGWNWSFADAQEYVQKWGCLVVGQNYTTDDGRTRIYIKTRNGVSTFKTGLSFTSEAGHFVNNPTIYWGDGTKTIANKTTTSTTYLTVAHTYANPGRYVIEIDVDAEKPIGIGYPGSNNGLMGFWGTANTVEPYKIEIGDNVTKLWRQTFNHMRELESISFPITCTDVDQNVDIGMFDGCSSLKALVFPSGMTGRDRQFITTTYNMKYISIPKSMTQIQVSASATHLRKFTMYSLEPVNTTSSTVVLGSCFQLTHFVVPGTYTTMTKNSIYFSAVRKVTVPASVTVIQTEAFWYSYFVDEYHFLSETPPTLNNTRAFVGINTGCKMYVPYSEDHSILEAYKTATNWSTYASRFVEEPQ